MFFQISDFLNCLDIFQFFWVFKWIFFWGGGFFLDFSHFLKWFLRFLIFWIFLEFRIFRLFFWFLWISYTVTKVTTESYQGYYWKPQIAKNGPKQHNKVFFCPKEGKRLGQSPPQELEVGPRRPYLLVLPSGGVASGWVCACSLRSRLVFVKLGSLKCKKNMLFSNNCDVSWVSFECLSGIT